MDNFLNIAKQGYAAYQESHSNVSTTGGSQYNSPHHSDQDGSRQGQGYGPSINHDEAIQTAQQHGSGNSDLFSSALGFVGANKDQHTDPVNEDEAIDAHKKVYEGGDTSNLSAHSIGSAAALQALKKFTSSSGGGGGTQTQLISMAMAEATKMFDQVGGQGNKQEAVNGAAMTVMKLLVQSKLGGSPFGGGSNSGGLSGILSLAGKFA